MTALVKITQDDTRACAPRPGDERGEPGRCVIANHVREQHPWARHISVGVKTIRVYDYRCEHNPAGVVGRCQTCDGRALVWATPLPAAAAIKAFDRGEDPTFPAFELRESEAVVSSMEVSGQRRSDKRRAGREREKKIKAGEHVPNSRDPRAVSRSKSDRRKG